MSHVWGWAWAEGTYIQDDTLQDCDSTGRPQYRHVAGTAYLYHNVFFWVGIKHMCSWAGEHFYHNGYEASPDMVQTGSWWITWPYGQTDDERFHHEPNLTVIGHQCGKLLGHLNLLHTSNEKNATTELIYLWQTVHCVFVENYNQGLYILCLVCWYSHATQSCKYIFNPRMMITNLTKMLSSFSNKYSALVLNSLF